MIRQLVNGVATQHISILDRGLHFGDGLFETILVKDAIIHDLFAHYQRLQIGCRRLNIALFSYDTFVQECGLLLGDLTDGVIKLIVTRGDAQRGYQYASDQTASRILILYPPVQYQAENWTVGIKTRLCQTRLGSNSQLAGLKHLNRLEQILARSEWSDPTITEGIMLDADDNVIEATMSNVFLVENKQLVTSALSNCGVAGIKRQKIIEYAENIEIPLRIENIPLHRLLCADEVFVSNSIIGIWPVIACDEHSFEFGPITRRLMNTLKVFSLNV